MKGDRERCLEAGMDDYTSKPFSQTVLPETLARRRCDAREMRSAHRHGRP